MDRRDVRRTALAHISTLEVELMMLEQLATDVDTGGDPIPAGELRRYVDALIDTLDKMYVWAGNL